MAQSGNQAIDANGHEKAMDYAEHDRTYGWFLLMVKWGVISNAILLIAMAAGFFGGWGLLGGGLVFIVLHVIAFLVL